MFFTICLRKNVQTKEEANTLLDIVKTKLADKPEVDIKASLSYTQEEIESAGE